MSVCSLNRHQSNRKAGSSKENVWSWVSLKLRIFIRPIAPKHSLVKKMPKPSRSICWDYKPQCHLRDCLKNAVMPYETIDEGIPKSHRNNSYPKCREGTYQHPKPGQKFISHCAEVENL